MEDSVYVTRIGIVRPELVNSSILYSRSQVYSITKVVTWLRSMSLVTWSLIMIGFGGDTVGGDVIKVDSGGDTVGI